MAGHGTRTRTPQTRHPASLSNRPLRLRSAAVAAVAALLLTPAPSATVAPTSLTSPGDLPYTVAATGSSEKKVFAHYFTPYPLSLDNRSADTDYYTRNYLNPAGENSKFAAYGGLLRDRPLTRTPLNGAWELADMRAEVRQAIAAGIDGFTVDLLNLSESSHHWKRTLLLMQAAHEVDPSFVIVPNVDMTASPGSADVSEMAAALAVLATQPAAYQLDDGQFVLSSFVAEKRTPAWWTSLFTTLSEDYGIDTAFIAVLLNSSQTNMEAFAPISYALSNWGTRNPGKTAAVRDYARAAHALGTKWMAPVAVQDVRPIHVIYEEAANLETLRATWQRAIDSDAELVQLVTWNDYSEATSFAPSQAHGWTFLQVSGYYLSAFKNGTVPALIRDGVFVTHRLHAVSASPTYTHTHMNLRSDPDATQPRDTVEVMTMLTTAAKVTVHIGATTHTYTAPAGIAATTFPLTTGDITVTTESAASTLHATSPITVTSRPYVQDLQYYGFSAVSTG